MTHPDVDLTQSGEAADAVRTLQAELNDDYSEMRSAELNLTEAILSAHAVTISGRAALQNIQRELIEAINNPVAALGTPAGERQFLLFLRSKIAEIQDIVNTGALTDEDHAKITRALGNGYLVGDAARTDFAPPAIPSTGPAPAAEQAAGILPAVGTALGALPQVLQGAATAPAQAAGGLAGAAAPLAGLASGLLGHSGAADVHEDGAGREPTSDEDIDEDRGSEPAHADTDETEDPHTEPPAPGDREPPKADGPAQTRPARLL